MDMEIQYYNKIRWGLAPLAPNDAPPLMMIMQIQFLIYLSAEINSQMANFRDSTDTYKSSNKIAQDKTSTKQQENGSAKAFTIKQKLLKIPVYLQTVLAAEGQYLGKQLTVVKLLTYSPNRITKYNSVPGSKSILHFKSDPSKI
jgi:hypothetical protein